MVKPRLSKALGASASAAAPAIAAPAGTSETSIVLGHLTVHRFSQLVFSGQDSLVSRDAESLISVRAALQRRLVARRDSVACRRPPPADFDPNAPPFEHGVRGRCRRGQMYP